MYAEWSQNKMATDTIVHKKILFSEEALIVIKINQFEVMITHKSLLRRHNIHKRSLYDVPYRQKESLVHIMELYKAMINDFFMLLLNDVDVDEGDLWFQ